MNTHRTETSGAGAPGSREGRTLVIGVGHRDRGDDAAGPIVADLIHALTAEVETVVREGDLAVLPLLWGEDDEVAIVDAVRSTGSIGSVLELQPSDLVSGAGWSTHGTSVADAIELSTRLGRLPRRLRIFGITGRRFDHGPMSPELRAALPQAAGFVLDALRDGPVSPGA